MEERTARELADVLLPEHDRTSCSDDDRSNSFFSKYNDKWYGRCRRCMLLDLADGAPLPDDYSPEDFLV